MKLEVGMYVRTIGGIERLKKENDNGWFFEKSMIIKPDNIEKYIIKASHNIIDLIEVGDVITTNNLCGEVTKIDIENNKIWIACCDYETCRIEDVKSIVTKEQMESMSYKVGE